MIALRTVLCPVDFSPATSRQIDLAVDLCRAFGARLVLHHNKHSLSGASIGWMWNADHQGQPQASLEARLQECLSRIPGTIPSEAHITEGPVSRAVLGMAEAFEADLIVLTTHGTHKDDHASITQQMLERSHRDVLVLHEAVVEPRTPRFTSTSGDPQVMLVPTDLSPESRPALELAFELARALPLEPHLLELLPNGRRHRDDAAVEEARSKLTALIPADLADRAKLHVEHGDPADHIVGAADRLSASCIVLGALARGAFQRWFGKDTPTAVLQQAHCPVWYVRGARVPQPQPKEFSGVGRI
jgi:universal stress protein A